MTYAEEYQVLKKLRLTPSRLTQETLFTRAVGISPR